MMNSHTHKRRVILDHDGGVDDMVALAVLASAYETVELIGTVCIDADCFIDHATQVAGKLLSGIQAHGRARYGQSSNPFEYLGSVPTGRSTLQAVHEFPREWRSLAVKMNDLPCMNTLLLKEQWEKNSRHEVAGSTKSTFKAGEELLAELVMQKGSPDAKITICVTGPLSNIAYCIRKYGKAFTDNVEEVVIMGGAVDVIGNVNINSLVDPKLSAEWNIYWDAPSAKLALEQSPPSVRNVLFSLDATNDVPIRSDFVQRFGLQKENSFLSEFIGSIYAMCTHFSYVCPGHTYFAWDGLTAAWLVKPSIIDKLEHVPLEVVIKRPDEGEGEGLNKTEVKEQSEEGRTKRISEEEAKTAGIASQCFVARGVHAQEFYDLVLALCSRV